MADSGAVLGDTTLASRAGSQPLRISQINVEDKWKSAPRITRKGFEVDWSRFIYFVTQKKLEQQDALANLPHLLDDELFRQYFPVFQRNELHSLDGAKGILRKIVGTKGPSSATFLGRKWEEGRETIAAFAFDLQSMAALLEYPHELLKSQFVRGLPSKLASKIDAMNTSSSTIEELSEFAERVQTAKVCRRLTEDVSAVNELKGLIEQQQGEIAALKENQFRQSSRREWRPYGGDSDSRRCFRCHQLGHVQRNCPKNGLGPARGPARY